MPYLLLSFVSRCGRGADEGCPTPAEDWKFVTGYAEQVAHRVDLGDTRQEVFFNRHGRQGSSNLSPSASMSFARSMFRERRWRCRYFRVVTLSHRIWHEHGRCWSVHRAHLVEWLDTMHAQPNTRALAPIRPAYLHLISTANLITNYDTYMSPEIFHCTVVPHSVYHFLGAVPTVARIRWTFRPDRTLFLFWFGGYFCVR